MSFALEFHDVVKTYGKRLALNKLNLSVPAGSIFGLVGSNGAGKTTAMTVTCGLLSIKSGSINLLGDGTFNPSVHAGRITLLPQDSRLPLHSKVQELLLFYGELQGLTGNKLRASVEEVLEWGHLVDRRNSTVKSLSHGMMRRLTIAQAFLGKPDLVLLDEPLSGLDPREANRIRAILKDRRGMQTIVISSHNLNDIEELCDTAAFIENGRLVKQDTLANIIKSDTLVNYYLKTADINESSIKEKLPEFGVSLEGNILTVKTATNNADVSAINARVIPVLLEAGAGILEIRCGSRLEKEYLEATEKDVSGKSW